MAPPSQQSSCLRHRSKSPVIQVLVFLFQILAGAAALDLVIYGGPSYIAPFSGCWLNYQKIIDIREKLLIRNPNLTMAAIGLAHVDETPDCQNDHKGDHPDENVEANCHEL